MSVLVSDYSYRLPETLIAQRPCDERDRSRLLRLFRETGELAHHIFSDLPRLLTPGDVLVVNDTAVVPARLLGEKAETGGRVEVLILGVGERDWESQAEFECLVKAAKPPRPGTQFLFDKGLSARVVSRENGRCRLRFFCEGRLGEMLAGIGRIPLPPYIRRSDAPRSDASDKTAYQTVYATQPGAVAAPTAGLHFTRPLLTRLAETGVQLVFITLHVGHGTFSPVRVTDIRRHRMHAERFYISEQAAAAVNRAKKEGRRIIAVGTTAVRTLEHAADETGCIAPGGGECDLFIYPGYRFCIVNALITNFHLPESTLLMLVSAFAGRRRVLDAYRAAIQEKYRFYSYGDAMLID